MGDVARLPEQQVGSGDSLPQVNPNDLRYEVQPLDYALLSLLPDEGSMLGKYHHLGRTTADLVKSLDDEYTKSSTVQTRLRLMKQMDLVIHRAGSVGANGRLIWQRTLRGKALLVHYGQGS